MQIGVIPGHFCTLCACAARPIDSSLTDSSPVIVCSFNNWLTDSPLQQLVWKNRQCNLHNLQIWQPGHISFAWSSLLAKAIFYTKCKPTNRLEQISFFFYAKAHTNCLLCKSRCTMGYANRHWAIGGWLGAVHKWRHHFWGVARPPPPPPCHHVIFRLPPPHPPPPSAMSSYHSGPPQLYVSKGLLKVKVIFLEKD